MQVAATELDSFDHTNPMRLTIASREVRREWATAGSSVGIVRPRSAAPRHRWQDAAGRGHRTTTWSDQPGRACDGSNDRRWMTTADLRRFAVRPLTPKLGAEISGCRDRERRHA
jgi:hypothetical protein